MGGFTLSSGPLRVQPVNPMQHTDTTNSDAAFTVAPSLDLDERASWR
jgi:hypothetical protein